MPHVAMPLVPALEALLARRRDQILITTMAAARECPKLSRHPLDLHYIPSAMSQAPGIGLGLALARPDREVIVLNGDGSMLMNLGSLVTIQASGARNLTLIVLDNGVYEVTGGQKTAAACAGADFAGFAAAAGWPTVARFDDLAAWEAAIDDLLVAPGPRFVDLRVAPVGPNYHLEVPGPLGERLARFRAALAAG